MAESDSWLNGVLAVPIIGLTTRQRVSFPALVWQLLEKVAAKWVEDGLGEGTIKAVSATDVRVDRGQGLYMNLNPSGVVVGYSFNLSVQRRPGALPDLARNATVETYSKLQANVLRVLTDFLDHGFGKDAFYDVVRMGIVAQTRLIESDAPPGVARYLDALTAAATGELVGVNGSLTHVLERRETNRDQCIHTCNRDSLDRPEDLELGLDFQRVWAQPHRCSASVVVNEMRGALLAANSYFERFGSGEE